MSATQSGGGGGGGKGGNVIVTKREPITVLGIDQTNGFFTMAWNTEKKTKFGDWGNFAVWQNNQLETVPVTTTMLNGKPDAYVFELSGIDSLIFIL